MTNELKRGLLAMFKDIERVWSNPKRANNAGQQKYVACKPRVLSENTAIIPLKKTNGKVCLLFAYHIKVGERGEWRYFIPTWQHVAGMEAFGERLRKAENYNFDKGTGQEPRKGKHDA